MKTLTIQQRTYQLFLHLWSYAVYILIKTLFLLKRKRDQAPFPYLGAVKIIVKFPLGIPYMKQLDKKDSVYEKDLKRWLIF